MAESRCGEGATPSHSMFEVERRQDHCMKTSWTWRKQLVRLDQGNSST
jgi:hypothetical protein